MNHVNRVLSSFSNLRALVIGDAILDTYSSGNATRLCAEAPVPVVTIDSRRDLPGGAANTAANVRAAGAQVHLLTVTGTDAAAGLLDGALQSAHIPTDGVIAEQGRRTLTKHRVVAGSQILVRFDEGDTLPVRQDREAALIERLHELAPQADVVIISDYGYGLMTARLIAELERLHNRPRTLLAVDAKQLASYRRAAPDLVKPNFQQAHNLVGIEPASPNGLSKAERVQPFGDEILEITGADLAAITLDNEGALIVSAGRVPYRTYARQRPNAQCCGAGDTFLAYMSLALAAGATPGAAAELASAAAAVVVDKDATATCSRQEVAAHISGKDKWIRETAAMREAVERERRHGRRIVFTNGCFDIVHSGHVGCLNQAKALGDVLIVGVNSDASVRELKGPGRPINPLEERVKILSALSCVDYVTHFDADTPVWLIELLAPDIYVKGGDYRVQDLPEAPVVERLGGQVRILPYTEDRSTTAIIERVRDSGRLAGAAAS
jgi:D-beta-D-heptose 7-phosphate kinase/D-beta-D-heptose 1-phosphate adenosyltransferase